MLFVRLSLIPINKCVRGIYRGVAEIFTNPLMAQWSEKYDENHLHYGE